MIPDDGSYMARRLADKKVFAKDVRVGGDFESGSKKLGM